MRTRPNNAKVIAQVSCKLCLNSLTVFLKYIIGDISIEYQLISINRVTKRNYKFTYSYVAVKYCEKKKCVTNLNVAIRSATKRLLKIIDKGEKIETYAISITVR